MYHNIKCELNLRFYKESEMKKYTSHIQQIYFVTCIYTTYFFW